MNPIKVNNLASLHALRNHEIGEMAFVKETEQWYVWEGSNWAHCPIEADADIGLTLYEVNKQLIAQLPTLSGPDWEEAKLTIAHYVNGLGHNDAYYMLLCYDIRYFTVFARDQKYEEKIESAVMDCIGILGELKAVELTEDGEALEIWVVTPEGEALVMYFFDYGKGVVPCQ